MSAVDLSLRWEDQMGGTAALAYRGKRVVGMVVMVMGDSKNWTYSVDAVSTKWITKGHGDVSSKKAAKRAVDRAWRDWLVAMEIVDVGGEAVSRQA